MGEEDLVAQHKICVWPSIFSQVVFTIPFAIIPGNRRFSIYSLIYMYPDTLYWEYPVAVVLRGYYQP